LARPLEKIKGRPQLSVEDAVSFVYHNLFWLKGNLNTEQKQDGKKTPHIAVVYISFLTLVTVVIVNLTGIGTEGGFLPCV
jgi:hypothetical protein